MDNQQLHDNADGADRVDEPDTIDSATVEGDLNGDGKVNAAERFIAKVGAFDDALEARAEQGGIVGMAAGMLHKVVDTLDADDERAEDPSGEAV